MEASNMLLKCKLDEGWKEIKRIENLLTSRKKALQVMKVNVETRIKKSQEIKNTNRGYLDV